MFKTVAHLSQSAIYVLITLRGLLVSRGAIKNIGGSIFNRWIVRVNVTRCSGFWYNKTLWDCTLQKLQLDSVSKHEKMIWSPLIFPVGVRSESHISRSPWETFWSRRPKHICFIKTWVWFALGSVEDYLMPTWTYISHRLVEISISQTSNYTDNHFCFPAPQHQISFRVAGKCFKPTLPFWWNESAFWLSCLPWCFVKFLPGNVL